MKSPGEKPRVRIIAPGDDRPTLPIIDGEGTATAIVWPGIGAQLRSMHQIVLGPGSSTVPLRHPNEAVYHVTTGTGQVRDLDSNEVAELRVGSMIHVGPGTGYMLVAGSDGAEIVGGPCPPDAALYTHLAETSSRQGG